MTKITIERETLERAITLIHQAHTEDLDEADAVSTALRAALAAQPAPVRCVDGGWLGIADMPANYPTRAAQPAEPVAWRFKLDGDLQWQHTDKWQILPCFGKVEPLYTHPAAPPAPVSWGWEFCEFVGPPPEPFTDWNTWAAGRVLRNVRVQRVGEAQPAPVPLTDAQLEAIIASTDHGSAIYDFARAIERAHGIAASPEVPRG